MGSGERASAKSGQGRLDPRDRGFRKIRMKLAGRGKNAGARVVYFHLKDHAVILLFLLYTKSGQSDLTAEQKAALRQQAHYLKQP